MALSSAQLIMLDTLIYSDYIKNGRRVKDIVADIETALQSNVALDDAGMTNAEWRDLIRTIQNDPALMEYSVQNLETQKSGMRAACFVNDTENPTDVNVVFRGTTTDEEWGDNGEGGYQSDTDIQKAAAEYVSNLPDEYGNAITVSGHSKGGNLAQYVTVALAKTENDRVANCVSIDGQGFSEEFCEKYADGIAEKKGIITSISASDDIVNALMYPIAGNRIYIKTEEQAEFFNYHKPNILLDANGNLREQTEQSELAVLLREYSIYIVSELEDPERQMLLDNLMNTVVAYLNGNLTTQDVLDIVSGAGSHVDDFLFNEIGERYGLGAEWAATYLATILCPVGLSVIFYDDLIRSTGKILNEEIDRLKEFADVVYKKLVSFGEKAKAFAEKFMKGLTKFAQGVSHWFNKTFNPGYQYAQVNPYIDVDTAKLRGYAQRLEEVNKRLSKLDGRIDKLYKKVGLQDLWNLLSADVLVGYSLKLVGCITYLNETASDFDKVEQDVARLF